MQIIEFNGLGQPRDPRFGTGTVAILVQGETFVVVRIELLPPEDFGPALEHATNQEQLADAVQQAVCDAFPSGLDSSRHWVLECPSEIAIRAEFRGDGHA